MAEAAVISYDGQVPVFTGGGENNDQVVCAAGLLTALTLLFGADTAPAPATAVAPFDAGMACAGTNDDAI